MYNRALNLKTKANVSFFLWGARQTGKSTLLKRSFPDNLYFDLLLSDVYERLQREPGQLRQIVQASNPDSPVIIDEIQKIPALLDEVHWLIENTSNRFILCGSSPRKIMRMGGNLLGGRASRYELLPLSFYEIPDFDLSKAIQFGLLPAIYTNEDPVKRLSAYIGNYLQQEIMAEARLRNVHSFSRFLEVAALTNGEMVNFSNLASDCGVSAPTVKDYFQILTDTLIGRMLPSFQKKPKRRVIKAPKFYFFDLGIANYLTRQTSIQLGSPAFGNAFEHFIYQEVYAYSQYSEKNFSITYWRTASQLEVDFILGDHQVALEVKSTDQVNHRHTKGLNAFSEEYTTQKSIVVSRDAFPRQLGDVLVLPWELFLKQLWEGAVI